MDLALKLASGVGADVIVANDPDADRCAVGVREGEAYRMLSGDQVGALLGDLWLRRGATGTYAASIVSSDLLGRQAAAHGQPWQQTLTGFKWIGKISDLAFGYEEALGYCVSPHLARDKDGVTAILAVLELAATLKAEGRTLLDRLDDIYREHGLHVTGQLAVRLDDLSIIADAMQVLRTSPPTDGLRYRLADGARIIVRPSGTEPKFKCYLEVVVPVQVEAGVDAARISAAARLDALRDDIRAAAGI